MIPRFRAWRALAAAALLAVGLVGPEVGQAGISNTRHNLSKNSKFSGTMATATSETQICVFCHTPHGASTSVNAPLWNRSVSTTGYTRYTSGSMDADRITDGFSAQPGGSSILCLSCHDGTIALGSVKVLNGVQPTVPVPGLEGTMSAGLGAATGYTRLLGKDLRNDHPISITYNDTLAGADGEMAYPAANTTIMGVRSRGYRPLLPLEATGTGGAGQVQCATCHDPHIEDATDPNRKFLRLNRLQKSAPTGGAFSKDNDIICLACHTKGGEAWSLSAHADSNVANEAYKPDAATLRQFAGTPQVWQVACLNCHDTHTAAGSRRLLREGVGVAAATTVGTNRGGTTTYPTATWQTWSGTRYQPGNATTGALNTVSSIESTCLQCHTDGTKSILSSVTNVPNLEAEFFNKPYRMPLSSFDQNSAGVEHHEIRNANFIECRKSLGNTAGAELAGDHLNAKERDQCGTVVASINNRHVECTDCHNPHRVRRNSKFYGTYKLGLSTTATHEVGGAEGNVASGVLRGTWGVEPTYTVTVAGSGSTVTGTNWPENPSFEVKYGDPGGMSSTARSNTYLTREYQLCFKCHSTYAVDSAAFPGLGNTGGGTRSGQSNGLLTYTNIAAEFAVRATDPPSNGTDQGELGNAGTACNGGDCEPVGSYPRGKSGGNGEINHRSWHPVVFPTGRDKAERAMASSGEVNMRAPWVTNMGKQTMHCSDCHGSDGSWTGGSGPTAGTVQGPHGSNNPFLLRGVWDTTVTLGAYGETTLCGKCHQPRVTNANGNSSGYSGYNAQDKFNYGRHNPDSNMGSYHCMTCHIAVPHGWKNKAFLVNLNCVGPEVGETTDCVSRGSYTSDYDRTPYYYRARLRISTWARSGTWTETSCGGDSMENCRSN